LKNKEGRNALDFVGLLVGNLFCGSGPERALDSARNSRMVSDSGETGDRSAELGLRASLDAALCVDGDCRVAIAINT